MRKSIKRFIAVLTGIAMIGAPGSARAGELCSTYAQVASTSTGGSYVGGILSSESMASVSRSQENTTTTTTYSGSLGGLFTSTQTVSVTQNGSVVTTQEPMGIYHMNDGTVWQINCETGASSQIG